MTTTTIKTPRTSQQAADWNQRQCALAAAVRMRPDELASATAWTKATEEQCAALTQEVRAEGKARYDAEEIARSRHFEITNTDVTKVWTSTDGHWQIRREAWPTSGRSWNEESAHRLYFRHTAGKPDLKWAQIGDYSTFKKARENIEHVIRRRQERLRDKMGAIQKAARARRDLTENEVKALERLAGLAMEAMVTALSLREEMAKDALLRPLYFLENRTSQTFYAEAMVQAYGAKAIFDNCGGKLPETGVLIAELRGFVSPKGHESVAALLAYLVRRSEQYLLEGSFAQHSSRPESQSLAIQQGAARARSLRYLNRLVERCGMREEVEALVAPYRVIY